MFEADARLGQIKVQVMKETRENSKPVDSYWLMAKPGGTVRGFVGIIIIIVVVIIILHLKKSKHTMRIILGGVAEDPSGGRSQKISIILPRRYIICTIHYHNLDTFKI